MLLVDAVLRVFRVSVVHSSRGNFSVRLVYTDTRFLLTSIREKHIIVVALLEEKGFTMALLAGRPYLDGPTFQEIE